MIRPRQFSENISTKKSHLTRNSLIDKYRDYVRHLTKTYNLSDEDLDDFVMNWNSTYDISQMSLSLIDEEDEMNPKNPKSIFLNFL